MVVLMKKYKCINDKVAALTNALTNNQTLLQGITEEVGVGQATRLDMMKGEIEVATAKSTLLDAQITASQAQRKKADLSEQINVANYKLQREATFLQEMTAALILVSPIAATFEPEILLGSFLKKGHVVGTLTA